MTSTTARLVVRPGLLLDVDSGELLADRAVVVGDGRIEAVVGVAESPADLQVVELPDLTVLPGLVDCHAHLVGERTAATATPSCSRAAARRRR